MASPTSNCSFRKGVLYLEGFITPLQVNGLQRINEVQITGLAFMEGREVAFPLPPQKPLLARIPTSLTGCFQAMLGCFQIIFGKQPPWDGDPPNKWFFPSGSNPKPLIDIFNNILRWSDLEIDDNNPDGVKITDSLHAKIEGRKYHLTPNTDWQLPVKRRKRLLVISVKEIRAILEENQIWELPSNTALCIKLDKELEIPSDMYTHTRRSTNPAMSELETKVAMDSDSGLENRIANFSNFDQEYGYWGTNPAMPRPKTKVEVDPDSWLENLNANFSNFHLQTSYPGIIILPRPSPFYVSIKSTQPMRFSSNLNQEVFP